MYAIIAKQLTKYSSTAKKILLKISPRKDHENHEEHIEFVIKCAQNPTRLWMKTYRECTDVNRHYTDDICIVKMFFLAAVLKSLSEYFENENRDRISLYYNQILTCTEKFLSGEEDDKLITWEGMVKPRAVLHTHSCFDLLFDARLSLMQSPIITQVIEEIYNGQFNIHILSDKKKMFLGILSGGLLGLAFETEYVQLIRLFGTIYPMRYYMGHAYASM